MVTHVTICVWFVSVVSVFAGVSVLRLVFRVCVYMSRLLCVCCTDVHFMWMHFQKK